MVDTSGIRTDWQDVSEADWQVNNAKAQANRIMAGPLNALGQAIIDLSEGGGGGGTDIQVGGTQPTSGWWLNNGTGGTPVTANVPTADDTANTITWTPKAGVEYVIGGSVRTSPYSVGDVTTSVTVTAQATSGYTLTGTSSWTFNFTGSAPADTTPPNPGTLAVTGSGDAGSTRTLTVTGASDAGGLHAQPYRFSTNGGSTWTTYQTSNTYITSALSAGTYQPRVMVRDAAGNTATASAADFTVAAAGATPFADDFNRADTTAQAGGLGAAWSQAAENNDWYISSNTAVQGGAMNLLIDIDLTVADATVEADVIVADTNGLQAGVTARRVGENTYYHARINADAGTLDLYRFIGGAATLLQQESGSYGVGTHRIGLSVVESGSATILNVTHNGTPKFVDVSDTTSGRPNGTRFGMRSNKGPTAVRFDDFTATPA